MVRRQLCALIPSYSRTPSCHRLTGADCREETSLFCHRPATDDRACERVDTAARLGPMSHCPPNRRGDGGVRESLCRRPSAVDGLGGVGATWSGKSWSTIPSAQNMLRQSHPMNLQRSEERRVREECR